MGPLVPDIIGNELNFIIAILIGIAFGFVLEQAGFSSSKKLVGLFYGYDFTVLRVFFTGGVVAMIGVIALSHWGLLDINLIYINPTFLRSAVVGGLIMGLGFVIGGFCPGTSVCAASIGKIDAMLFILGSFIGVFIFAEAYPLFEGLYLAEYWGNVNLYDSLGLSRSLVAFLIAIVAISAFWAITFVEKKVNGKLNPEFSSKPLYISLTVLAVGLALTVFAFPMREESLQNKVDMMIAANSYNINYMDTDELAFRIFDDDQTLQIFDFRNKADYDSVSLPKSNNLTIQNLFEKDAHQLLSIKGKTRLFVSYNENTALKAALIARELGYKDIHVLKGGWKQFQADIINFKMPEIAENKIKKDTYRFRAEASVIIPEKIKENKAKQSGAQKKESKRVIGGC